MNARHGRISVSHVRMPEDVMFARSVGSVILALAVAWPVTALAAPQGAGSSTAKAPAARSPVDQGAEMFRGYCGACHGSKGVGDGPAAASLKTKPTDLTKLAASNKGQFPAQRVAMVLEFGVAVPAHGSTDMPTWGSTFRVMGDEATVRQRVTALTRYLETIQVK
jgi:mono/diheme cytochrome c family protein